MERTILAYLTVDEDRAFEEMKDGPISYLEREAGWLEQSGIHLEDAAIVDDDAEDPKERYLVYLARFAFEHLSDGDVYPMMFREWMGNETSVSMIGRTALFDTHGVDSQLNERSGSKALVVRPLTADEVDIADVGNMYRIRFDDGFETDAFEDELTAIEEKR